MRLLTSHGPKHDQLKKQFNQLHDKLKQMKAQFKIKYTGKGTPSGDTYGTSGMDNTGQYAFDDEE